MGYVFLRVIEGENVMFCIEALMVFLCSVRMLHLNSAMYLEIAAVPLDTRANCVFIPSCDLIQFFPFVSEQTSSSYPYHLLQRLLLRTSSSVESS